MDSIFKRARDKATGAATVIAAAKYFAQYPPKRSVLFICYTAEEEGELGSKYYAQHPLIPLDHSIFNLNIDNAGYNTTNAVCLFGLCRKKVDFLIQKESGINALAALLEPGGRNLFQCSDNNSSAERGIQAPSYSLGMKYWDNAIDDRYHRLSDEVENMDLTYVARFIRAYILCAQYIANDHLQPNGRKAIRIKKNGKSCSERPINLFRTSVPF
jgi:Zn-dependent M28 family amino/carboxypeptidase